MMTPKTLLQYIFDEIDDLENAHDCETSELRAAVKKLYEVKTTDWISCTERLPEPPK